MCMCMRVRHSYNAVCLVMFLDGHTKCNAFFVVTVEPARRAALSVEEVAVTV